MKPKSKKDAVIFVRSDERLIKRLQKAAELTDVNVSHLTREAIREKLERLSEKYPQLSTA